MLCIYFINQVQIAIRLQSIILSIEYSTRHTRHNNTQFISKPISNYPLEVSVQNTLYKDNISNFVESSDEKSANIAIEWCSTKELVEVCWFLFTDWSRIIMFSVNIFCSLILWNLFLKVGSLKLYRNSFTMKWFTIKTSITFFSILYCLTLKM